MSFRLIIISIVAASTLIAGAVFLKNNDEAKSTTSELASVINKLETGSINEKYYFTITLGEPGSEHTHASVAFFIDGEQIDFAQQKYMLRSRHMHFEHNDGATIHKHAIGVNLPAFFASLDIRINQDCFMLDITKEYCNNEMKKLTFIRNGELMNNVYDELRDGDKILINYGNDSEEELQSKFNTIPDPSF